LAADAHAAYQGDCVLQRVLQCVLQGLL